MAKQAAEKIVCLEKVATGTSLRSAEALLPPHKCGGSRRKDYGPLLGSVLSRHLWLCRRCRVRRVRAGGGVCTGGGVQILQVISG